MDVARLPSREKFDKWRAQGRQDARAADERGVLEGCGLVRTAASGQGTPPAAAPASSAKHVRNKRAETRSKTSPSKTRQR